MRAGAGACLRVTRAGRGVRVGRAARVCVCIACACVRVCMPRKKAKKSDKSSPKQHPHPSKKKSFSNFNLFRNFVIVPKHSTHLTIFFTFVVHLLKLIL